MRRLVHATSFLLMLGLAGPANALPRPDRELVRARLGGSADATFTRDGSRLTGLTRLSVQTTGDSPRTRATSFVKAHRDLLSLGDKDSVEAIEVKALPRLTGPARPSQVVRLRQLHRDLPVEGRELVVTLDGSDRVIAVRSDVGALDVPTPGHELSADEAIAATYETFAISSHGKPEKVILANGSAGRIAWRVPVSVLPLSGFATVWIDIEDGRVLREARVGHDHGLTELPRHNASLEETP